MRSTNSPYRDRPYTVTESLYDVREIEPADPDAAARLRIFFPFQIASRTTQWERGSDPMTQFAFTGGHDAYGLPRTRLAVAVPRGRNPLLTLNTPPAEPYLSTHIITDYAQRDDGQRYIVDQVARTTGYEVVNDGRQSVFALRNSVGNGSVSLRVTSHVRTFYDGEAFVGLPLGQIGEFGAAVRSESLVFTDEFLSAAFDPNRSALGQSASLLSERDIARELDGGISRRLPRCHADARGLCPLRRRRRARIAGRVFLGSGKTSL